MDDTKLEQRMKIYVGTEGEKQSGGSVVCVSRDRQRVVDRLLALTPCFGPWEQVNSNCWESSGDYIRVEEFETL